MHCSWGMGETRRDEVDLPDRSVREEILESRIAFLGTLGGVVTRAVEESEIKRVMRTIKGPKAGRTRRHIMAAIQKSVILCGKGRRPHPCTRRTKK